jgi:fido (protein-threonine AMPylation protein)
VYRRLEEAVQGLHEQLGGLPSPVEAEAIWKGIWYEEAHHSTAIEGNTLVLKQVEVLLAEGRAVGNKQLAEYMEVRGYADAANWVYGQAIISDEWADGLLTVTEVRHIHRMAMNPVWDVAPHPDVTDAEGPGGFREHEIRQFPGGMAPPSFVEVPALIDDWIVAMNGIDGAAGHVVEEMARLHNRFEQIHPFLDGNGRAGRLVMNLVLIRLGYPPAIIHKRDRRRYLRAMQRADAGDPGSLGELIARSILDNLYRFIIPGLAGPYRVVPIAALATSELNVAALRTAAARGRLKAQKASDGQWRSSQAWVEEYVANRYKRQAD